MTAYTNRACHKLSNEEHKVLRRLRFVAQKTALPTSPAPKPGDPNDDLTLLEFYESDKTKPMSIPPRTKPEVKIKPSPTKKTKGIIHPPSDDLPEDADYIAGFLDEATDVELKFHRVVVDLRQDRSLPQMSEPSHLLKSLSQKLHLLCRKQKKKREVDGLKHLGSQVC